MLCEECNIDIVYSILLDECKPFNLTNELLPFLDDSGASRLAYDFNTLSHVFIKLRSKDC